MKTFSFFIFLTLLLIQTTDTYSCSPKKIIYCVKDTQSIPREKEMGTIGEAKSFTFHKNGPFCVPDDEKNLKKLCNKLFSAKCKGKCYPSGDKPSKHLFK